MAGKTHPDAASRPYGARPHDPRALLDPGAYGAFGAPAPTRRWLEAHGPYNRPGEHPPPSEPAPPASPAPGIRARTRGMARGPGRRLVRRVALGGVAAVALVVCLVGGTIGFRSVREITTAIDTATALCVDLGAQDYVHAYSLLSPSLQKGITLQHFVALERLATSAYGRVRSCGNVSDVSVQSRRASLHMEITRAVRTSGGLLLVKQGDAWRIDAVTGQLQVV